MKLAIIQMPIIPDPMIELMKLAIRHLPIIPDPMIELMKLKLVIGTLLSPLPSFPSSAANRCRDSLTLLVSEKSDWV